MQTGTTRGLEGHSAPDESIIRGFYQHMIDGWNRGVANEFASAFSERADFIAFEGTHLKGRNEIAKFHQNLFDTVVKGTRLEGEVLFIHFLSPRLATMHAVARIALAGQQETSPSRDSMQLFVIVKEDSVWRIEGMLNARKLTLERQQFLDDLDSLPVEAKQRVSELVNAFKS